MRNQADRRPVRASSLLLGCRSWGDVRLALRDATEKLKGDTFELLVQHYLGLSEEHGFRNVWSTHGRAPVAVLKKLGLDGRDTKGIDLIAETDFGEYVAVQAKYHQDEERALTQKECEGLVAGMTLAKGGFLRGLICTNAIEHSRNLKYEVQYLKYERWSALDEVFFGRLHAALRGEEPRPPKASDPRPHQQEAVAAAYEDLFEKGHDRCRVIMACATGKTHTAFFLAEKLGARKLLIAVPNLSLADQHIQNLAPEYAARGLRAKWLAVCSDKSVGQEDDDASLSLPREDLRIVNVSTDADEVADWFRQYSRAERLVVFSTYQSGEVLGAAAKQAGLNFDLGVFDEAHRTAGPKDGPFAYLLHAGNVDIGKRVFMTATERLNRQGLDHIVGMNEPEWYGAKVYDLPTREAVKRGIIADYRVVILACSIEATRRLIEQRRLVHARRWKKAATASMLATGVGLRQVMKEHDLKHGLSFHSSITRMREFEEMQAALSLDLADEYGELNVFPFSCEDSAGERRKNRELFEASGRALASNVRVFVEGVDCPDIDLVAFADPKQSKIDIVQAVGRAIRPARDRSPKTAYVYVPVLVDQEGEPSNASFRQVMNILRALKERDDSIGDDVRVMVQEDFWTDTKARMEFRVAAGLELDAKEFAKGIGTRIWEGGGGVEGLDEGRTGIAAARALASQRGFTLLSTDYRNAFSKYLWRCSKGHEWRARFNNVQQGSGCPMCAGVVRKTIDDARRLAAERGLTFLSGGFSNTGAKHSWGCGLGHRWEAAYNAIQQGYGCPQCSGVAPKTIDDARSLGARRGFRFLSERFVNSRTKCTWQCLKGHEWLATYSDIRAGYGCPYCAGVAKKTIDDYRALGKKLGFDFLDKVAPHTTQGKAPWRCAKGHVWLARYDHLSRGVGCPRCSGVARNTIGDALKVARERGYSFLSKKFINAQTKYLWRCSEGHEWWSTYNDVRRGYGCGRCARKSRRTLDDYHALARERDLRFLGKAMPANAQTKALWRCGKGHRWESSFSSISSGRGCPECGHVLSSGVRRVIRFD